MTTPRETDRPLAGGAIPSGMGVRPDPDAGAALADSLRTSVTVAAYDNYAAAQRAVDYLSDSGFPVEQTAIVGTDLRLVEQVLGRMTIGRAALTGAAGGAWFGLFIGLLFGIFSLTDWLWAVLAGLLIGAAWGAVFGAIAHAMTGGRRDFTSMRTLAASQYAVTVDAGVADQARNLLARIDPATGLA
jgi:hypothetical protein